jgi:hypothetical protein
MKKARFLASFFVLFAALLVAWTRSRASEWYTGLLLAVSGPVGAALHGWVLERGAGAVPTWVHGGESIALAIQFDALAVGLVPLVALLGATHGIPWRRRLLLIAAGIVICFVFHALVVVLWPLLVYHKNPFTDVVGTFLGLTSFVGAPVIIWFVLAFPTIRTWLPTFRPRAARAR